MIETKQILIKSTLFFTLILKGFSQTSVLDDVDSLLNFDDTKENTIIQIDRSNLNQIYGGKFSSSYTFSDLSIRHSERLSFYWEKKINESFGFKTEFRILNSQISTTLEREETNIETGARTITKEIEVLNSFEIEPRDVYLQFDNNNWHTTIGYQTFTIGVGTLSSPLDFLLIPDRSDSLPINLNRLDEKLSQPIVKLNYQNSGFDFTYYYHPIFTVDNFVKQQFLKKEDDFQPKLPQEDRHLLRLLYRGNNFVTGFTFYKGPNPKFFTDILEVEVTNIGQEEERANESFYDRVFDDLTVFAWEYAYTKNKWRYSIELGVIDGFSESLPPQRNTNPNFLYNNFIINNNNGLLLGKDTRFITTNIGFDYTGNKCAINFYITAIIPQLSSITTEAIRLFEQESNAEHAIGESLIFVTINYSYFLNKEKNKILGFALGNFTNTFGAGFYYKNQVNDNLSYSLTLGVVSYSTDEELFENDDGNTRTTIVNDTPAVVSFSMQYSF